jgi:hypothetical protein
MADLERPPTRPGARRGLTLDHIFGIPFVFVLCGPPIGGVTVAVMTMIAAVIDGFNRSTMQLEAVLNFPLLLMGASMLSYLPGAVPATVAGIAILVLRRVAETRPLVTGTAVGALVCLGTLSSISLLSGGPNVTDFTSAVRTLLPNLLALPVFVVPTVVMTVAVRPLLLDMRAD